MTIISEYTTIAVYAQGGISIDTGKVRVSVRHALEEPVVSRSLQPIKLPLSIAWKPQVLQFLKPPFHLDLKGIQKKRRYLRKFRCLEIVAYKREAIRNCHLDVVDFDRILIVFSSSFVLLTFGKRNV